MNPGILIVIGTLAIVVGFMPPGSVVSVVAGLFCVFMGYQGLREQSKKGDNNGESNQHPD